MNILCSNNHGFNYETSIYDRLMTSIFLIVASDEYALFEQPWIWVWDLDIWYIGDLNLFDCHALL